MDFHIGALQALDQAPDLSFLQETKFRSMRQYDNWFCDNAYYVKRILDPARRPVPVTVIIGI